MKGLVAFLLLWSSSAIAQEVFTLDLPISASEKPGAPVLADINGDGEPELCTRVRSSTAKASDNSPRWLVAYDLKFRREMGRIRNLYRESFFHPVDLDGDGREELVTINYVVWGNKPGFVVFRWENGQFTRTEVTSFDGHGGVVGDIDGDGRDEIILSHLPEGFTSPGGFGPTELQVIAWNGTGFELKASTAYPATYFVVHAGDLNGNGRDEIAVLRSGYKRPHLSIFGYDHSPNLVLLDEWESPNVYNDNLVRLWGEPLPGNKQRLIIPIPEQYWEHRSGPKRIQFFGFQFTRQGIMPERDPLVFTEFQNYEYNNPLPIYFQPASRRMDVNGDGVAEVIKLRGGQMRFVPPITSIR